MQVFAEITGLRVFLEGSYGLFFNSVNELSIEP
jgi:hypothetical protein